jgi:uncharacterized protein
MEELRLLAGSVLSLGIGLSLALIGGGGSSITVPMLVYVLGIPVREAIPMSLAVVGSTSAIAAVQHGRRGNVRLAAATLFAVASAVTSYFSTQWTYLASEHALLLGSAAVMMLVAYRMWVSSDGSDRSSDRPSPLTPSSSKVVAAGLGVGVLTGFLGVGGGSLIVPALALFAGLGLREAIGTSLVVISFNCLAGFLGHLGHGGFPIRSALLVAAIAAAGTLMGSAIAPRISTRTLRKVFSLLVLVIALAITLEIVYARLVSS